MQCADEPSLAHLARIRQAQAFSRASTLHAAALCFVRQFCRLFGAISAFWILQPLASVENTALSGKVAGKHKRQSVPECTMEELMSLLLEVTLVCPRDDVHNAGRPGPGLRYASANLHQLQGFRGCREMSFCKHRIVFSKLCKLEKTAKWRYSTVVRWSVLVALVS